MAAKHGSKGLKAIRVQPAASGQFKIETSASPLTFMEKAGVLTKTDYGYVAASLAVDDTLVVPEAFNGEGSHAEEKIIPVVDRYVARFSGKPTMPKKVGCL